MKKQFLVSCILVASTGSVSAATYDCSVTALASIVTELGHANVDVGRRAIAAIPIPGTNLVARFGYVAISDGGVLGLMIDDPSIGPLASTTTEDGDSGANLQFRRDGAISYSIKCALSAEI